MSLVPLTPWEDLERLHGSISKMLEGDFPPFDANSERRGGWLPLVDIRETSDALVVHAELPGIDKKDVHLDIRDGTLTISGERKHEKEVTEESVHRLERAYGRFSRSFTLPRDIDVDKVNATMKNGVLEVRLAKVESAKPKAITIH